MFVCFCFNLFCLYILCVVWRLPFRRWACVSEFVFVMFQNAEKVENCFNVSRKNCHTTVSLYVRVRVMYILLVCLVYSYYSSFSSFYFSTTSNKKRIKRKFYVFFCSSFFSGKLSPSMNG